MPDRAAFDRMADSVFAAMTKRQDIPVERIEFSLAAPRAFATVGAAHPLGPSVRIDAETGDELPAMKPHGFHGILQDLHAGYLFGLPGRIVSTLLGATLL